MRHTLDRRVTILSHNDPIHGLLIDVAPPEMRRMTSATIIPFPRLARSPDRNEGQERLRLALAELEAALAAQREAVAKWRGALGDLRDSVRGLGTSLQAYNDRLGALGERVGMVNSEARRLEKWADNALQIK
jgi:hypothetical protein